MTTRKKSGKQNQQRYPDEYKFKDLKLAERVGTTAAGTDQGYRSLRFVPGGPSTDTPRRRLMRRTAAQR